MRRDRLAGKPLAVFIDAGERMAFRVSLLKVIMSGEASRRMMLAVLGRGQARREVSATVGIVRDHRQQPTALRWLLADESAAVHEERERMIAAANEARAVAEAANLAKTQLLATVSHELRTPLAAIAGYAELLELGLRGPLSPEQLADIKRMRAAQEHMLNLLDDLLLYFRLGLGGLTAEVSRVPLHDILTGLASFVAPQANQRRIAIDVGEAPAETFVMADVDRARQILINLLMNAVKFSPAGSTTRILVLENETEVVLQVCDAGPGIAAEQVEAAFEPFVQLKPGKSARTGFGLGLAISRKLAELMGGSLRLAPGRPESSVFSLHLRRG